jgi:hypothetical protein
MNKFRLSRRLATGIAVAAAVAGGGSVAALATSQSPASAYQGCLSRNLGALYNVHVNPNSPPRCHRRDTLISWNQTGPAGSRGATGATGAPGSLGAKGSTGPTGSQGPQGLKGDPGATGVQGLQGPKGDPGATGAQGPPGPTGSQGPNGNTGPQGPSGTTTSNVVIGSFVQIVAGGNATALATCPSGSTATGGGFDTTPGIDVQSNVPASDGTQSWEVDTSNPTSIGGEIRARVVCVS